MSNSELGLLHGKTTNVPHMYTYLQFVWKHSDLFTGLRLHSVEFRIILVIQNKFFIVYHLKM
jgi:hypothetical protein